jgi:hypothetical protein
MAAMTGSSQMSAKALLDYFRPLNTYLEDRIKEMNITVGWRSELPDFFKDPKQGKESDETIPIVVGAVIGGIAVVLLVVFVIGRRRRRSRRGKPGDNMEMS